jgi:hypothetical protein
VPTLDLRFADNKSLTDAVTGASLVTFTRASSGTFVDSAGVLQTAATDVPRFDHNPTTGESLGLLVEEQRTNLLLRSEEFDDAYWTKTAVSITANAGVAPDGLTTADKFIPTASTAGNAALLISSSIAKAASATTYSFSCFAKAAEFSGVRLLVRDVASNSNRAEATVTLATLAESGITVLGTFSNLTFSVRPFINGWHRLAITFTTGTETSINARVTGIVSEVGDGTSGFLIWGAQHEAGAFPTSYIKNIDTALGVTRSADVASITGSAFSSWYNSTAGTMRAQWVGASNGCRSFNCEDAGKTNTERFAQRITSNFLQTEVTSNSVAASRSASGAGTVTYPATITACSAYDVTDCVIAFRGNVSSTATANGGPECGEIFIGSFRGTSTFANGPIARLTYWPQLLASSTLSVLAP